MMDPYKNKDIVVPYDFSDNSFEAVETAIEFAEDVGRVHVIHVVPPEPAIVPVDPSMPIPPSYDQLHYQSALDTMKERFGSGNFEGVKVACVIGDPGSEIVEFAKQVNAELIVMPSHGRTGLTRLMLGSVAERVLRLSECPVLILRKPSK